MAGWLNFGLLVGELVGGQLVELGGGGELRHGRSHRAHGEVVAEAGGDRAMGLGKMNIS